MKNLTMYKQLWKSGSLFFFAGSGVSYNSGMARVDMVLNSSFNIFLNENWDKKIENIQPEIFYENLLMLSDNTENLKIWKILNKSFCQKKGLQYKPNINHYAIVDYSYKNNVPIFTTNFDTLFEEAAIKMGYDYSVILAGSENEKNEKEYLNILVNYPAKNKSNVVIVKLHGSISSDENDFTNLYTTMTQISKKNETALAIIEFLLKTSTICFVGYSGRDVDFFPEIKKIITNRPFWIDSFSNKTEATKVTYSNAESINAIKVATYPDILFEKITTFENTRTGIDEKTKKAILELENEIKNTDIFNFYEKIFLYALTLKDIGEYIDAYNIVIDLLSNNNFEEDTHLKLMVQAIILSHERGKFEQCYKYSKELLLKSQKINNDTFKVIGLIYMSEARRMLIAHDTSFDFNINYYASIIAIGSFLRNKMHIKKISNKIKSNKIIDVFAKHQIIEHDIRLYALLQSWVKIITNKFSFFTKSLNGFLIKKWEDIENRSKKAGYSQGIANATKFKFRLLDDLETFEQGHAIYKLTKAKTGEALSSRNLAEHYIGQKKYHIAIEEFTKMYNTGKKSGVTLNAIKGLLGIAKCNLQMEIKPILNAEQIQILTELMNEIEGSNWQNYFKKVLIKIQN